MAQGTIDRRELERAVTTVRRRAADLVPFSPSWDAVMAEVEELERALWQLERGDPQSGAPSRQVVLEQEAAGA
jgi:hypothetical protein